MDPADVQAALGRMRDGLFAARARRPRPHLDDKVLTAWNGLMIAAFARAARVLPDSRAAAADSSPPRAARPASSSSTLWSRGDDSCCAATAPATPESTAYAEDYAFLIFGLLELFQADGDVRWLEWAQDASDASRTSASGTAAGRRLVQHHRRDPTVLLRLKEDYDGAEPSASSISVLNLLTLVALWCRIGPGRWRRWSGR